MRYNTAVSSLMILSNEYDKLETITKSDFRILLTLLNPIAPHIAEELVSICHLGTPICETKWPTYNEEKLIDSTTNIAVSVNGKLRGTMNVLTNTQKDELLKKAKELEKLKKLL